MQLENDSDEQDCCCDCDCHTETASHFHNIEEDLIYNDSQVIENPSSEQQLLTSTGGYQELNLTNNNDLSQHYAEASSHFRNRENHVLQVDKSYHCEQQAASNNDYQQFASNNDTSQHYAKAAKTTSSLLNIENDVANHFLQIDENDRHEQSLTSSTDYQQLSRLSDAYQQTDANMSVSF